MFHATVSMYADFKQNRKGDVFCCYTWHGMTRMHVGASDVSRSILRWHGCIIISSHSNISRFSCIRSLVMTKVQFGFMATRPGPGHSSQVMWRYARSLSISSYEKRYSMRIVSLCSTHQDALTDMHVNRLLTSYDIEVTWGHTTWGQTLASTFWRQYIHVVSVHNAKRNAMPSKFFIDLALGFFVHQSFAKQHVAIWYHWPDLTDQQLA